MDFHCSLKNFHQLKINVSALPTSLLLTVPGHVTGVPKQLTCGYTSTSNATSWCATLCISTNYISKINSIPTWSMPWAWFVTSSNGLVLE